MEATVVQPSLEKEFLQVYLSIQNIRTNITTIKKQGQKVVHKNVS